MLSGPEVLDPKLGHNPYWEHFEAFLAPICNTQAPAQQNRGLKLNIYDTSAKVMLVWLVMLIWLNAMKLGKKGFVMKDLHTSQKAFAKQ